MVKKMLINAVHPEESRVAVVADGILEEFDVQIRTREPTQGNIYKGIISRVEPSLQAAFVDYGAGRNGFLSVSDVHPSYFPESYENSRRRPRLEEIFQKDAHVVVQVSKEERENKGAGLTTNISLAGRFLVLMPGTDLHGVSRKIEDDKEREKLREIMGQMKLPEEMGFIIRTAGLGRTKTELLRDLNYVMKLWKSIEKNVAEQPAPALLFREQDIVIRSIRDHFSPDISEILVDDKAVFNKVRSFFHQIMPRHEKLVKLYLEKRPLFNKYQLEEQVEQVYRRRINLKSGGYVLIEPTEALVTVDVNSGAATKEKGIAETAFRVNMEAAPEIARHLRLRDLGGIIVIDFIDMANKKHNQAVEKAFKDALKKDRARLKTLRISALGLLELSRQRLKSSLGTGEYLHCPLCQGKGKIRSPEVTALSMFRKIKSLAIRPDVTEINAVAPAKVAEYLLNNMRALLVQVEQEYGARVTVFSKDPLSEGDILVEAVSKAAPDQAEPEPEPEAVAPPPAEELADEEESAPQETEAKKAKKPARRRRRPKRKTTQEDADPADISAVEPDDAQPATDSESFRQTGPDAAANGSSGQPEGPSESDVSSEQGSEEDEKKPKGDGSWLRSYLPFA
jgi:ribonuclease E